MEPVRGQDDRKRERHAMDGVWLPAGGRQPDTRGLPDSRHTPRPGVKGAGPFAPLPTPPTGGWQIAPADRVGTGQINQAERSGSVAKPIGLG
jgi:hypothetical protein